MDWRGSNQKAADNIVTVESFWNGFLGSRLILTVAKGPQTMKRFITALIFCFPAWCTNAFAGSWADGLFSELRHEFGNIPRGSDQRCTFILRNTTESSIRISTLSRTCGCTQITLDDKVVLDQNIKNSRENKLVPPGQEAQIGVVLDTRTFTGPKSAEIIVSFDQPAYAEVRLTVNSFIRQDIVLNPGAIQLGNMSHGMESAKELDIEYAGSANWQVLSVTKQNSNLDVKYDEIYRKPGQVGYRVHVALKPTAPVGIIRDALMVETNDLGAPQFSILVTAQIQPDLIVTPSNLSMGTVKPGQTVTRQVIVRGKKPFQVLGVESGADSFQVEKPDGTLTFHKVTVRFAGSDEPGTRECTFKIQTDLADESTAEFKAIVNVVR
jgi:hypothetical protein